MKALQIDHFGTVDGLEIRDVPDAPLPDDAVRVEIEAAGVNPSDVGVALGRFPQTTLPRVLGRDFAGRVIEGAKDLIGASVWGSGGGELGITRDGSHAERIILPSRAAALRPAHLSAEEAAAVGVPFVTAWSAVVELAGTKADEWVIVSGAAGAVGTAAIQLVSALGGHAIALVRERTNLAPVEGLNVAAIVRSDRDNVPEAVRTITNGHGADVALNAVGAPVFQPLLQSLAKGGRMVILSASGGREVQLDLFAFYRGRYTCFGFDTAALSLDEIARLFAKMTPFFASKAVKPPPIAQRFPLSRAREAYERVQSGGSGKVVLIPDRLFS